MAKQTSHYTHHRLYIPPLFLGPSSSLGQHCFTKCLPTCPTCYLMIWILPDPCNWSLTTHQVHTGWMPSITDDPQKGLQKWMACESCSLFMALRYSVFPEAELHEATSSSEVDDQSPLVKRLDIELRQSDQKGEALVTGPRRCVVLNLLQCV